MESVNFGVVNYDFESEVYEPTRNTNVTSNDIPNQLNMINNVLKTRKFQFRRYSQAKKSKKNTTQPKFGPNVIINERIRRNNNVNYDVC